ncbi:hypothetical protein [Persicobacter diffluens]|uniref:STAS/SEC14 domain-containing protein n=1 Tax=Persicobacter diffluens TaxID=981 RepID=A0AAN4VV19_9BACT|nr:hypothetical protein PEDI_12110 [Persicobacter diffluens]
MIVFQTEYVDLIYNTEFQAVELIWKDVFTTEEYQKTVDEALRLMRVKKLSRWISDLRGLPSPPDHSLTWIGQQRFERVRKIPAMEVILITGTKASIMIYGQKMADILDKKFPNAHIQLEINRKNAHLWFQSPYQNTYRHPSLI